MTVKRSLIALVIIALISVAIVLIFNTIDPAPAHGDTRHSHSQSQSHSPKITPILTDPKVWGPLMSFQLHHGKLGNSGGRWLPDRVVRRLNRYKKHHPKVPVWWTGAMAKTECFANGLTFPAAVVASAAFCMKYGQNPTIHQLNKKIIEIKIGCGAGMVVGALSGGGTFGAIAGAAAGCAFTGIATNIIDSSVFDTTRPGAYGLHPTSTLK